MYGLAQQSKKGFPEVILLNAASIWQPQFGGPNGTVENVRRFNR